MSGSFTWELGATLTTPGPDLSFMTGGVGDDYYVNAAESGFTTDVRVETTDAPRAHGVIMWPPKKGAAHLRIVGQLKPATDTAAARDNMAVIMEAAADALMGDTLGTFTCSRGSIGVSLEMYPVFTGAFRRTFVIVLLAPDPTWS